MNKELIIGVLIVGAVLFGWVGFLLLSAILAGLAAVVYFTNFIEPKETSIDTEQDG